jgi:predicted aspartyl protease
MVRRLFVLSLAALASSTAVGAQTINVAPPRAAPQVDKTTQTEDVRFKNEYYDRMTVPVRLGGAGPYRFLVDTGSNRTTISRELASRLSLPAGAGVALHSVAGVSNTSTAKVPNVQLTRKVVKIADAPLLDSANMGADGILGTDSLSSQRVVFDFTTQTMSIVPSETRDFVEGPNVIVVEGKRRNGRLVVTDATANGHDVTVVVDTGSQVSIGNDALRAVLFGNRGNHAEPIEIQSVTGGKINGEATFVETVVIGGVTLQNLGVVFAPAHTFEQLKLDKKPALLLGMNAIRAFKKVSIDFTRLTMRVVVPEHSALDTQVAAAAVNPLVSR